MKSTVKASIPTIQSISLAFSAAGICLILLGAIYFQFTANVSNFKNSIHVWEPELAKALVVDDWVLIRKLTETLHSNGFSSIAITKQDSTSFVFPADSDPSFCSWKIAIPISRYGVSLGSVEACPSLFETAHSVLSSPSSLTLSLAIGIVLSLFCLGPLFRYKLGLHKLLAELKLWSTANTDFETFPIEHAVSGHSDRLFKELYEVVARGTQQKIEAERLRLELQNTKALGDLAAQVSHDIRSPLAALQSVIHNSHTHDHNSLAIIRSSTNRIKDIANGLLLNHREFLSLSNAKTSGAIIPVETSNLQTQVHLVSSSIESILAEKRAEISGKSLISINASYKNNAELAFASLEPLAFSRILSNLINNSIEAIEHPRGNIEVILDQHNKSIFLTIRDNGKGITKENLLIIGKKGFTSGKSNGCGLGLSHAISTISGWDGKLTVSSTIGKGTSVEIKLPIATPPPWVLSSALIRPNSTVVVIDDDLSIHQLWQKRLTEIARKTHIKIVTLSSPRSLLEWYRANLEVENVIYFCDYNFPNSTSTGLDIIESIGVGSSSVLVTSSWEDDAIQKRCQKTGTKLLPKEALANLPISVA